MFVLCFLLLRPTKATLHSPMACFGRMVGSTVSTFCFVHVPFQAKYVMAVHCATPALLGKKCRLRLSVCLQGVLQLNTKKQIRQGHAKSSAQCDFSIKNVFLGTLGELYS